jgi:uncharacterized protein
MSTITGTIRRINPGSRDRVMPAAPRLRIAFPRRLRWLLAPLLLVLAAMVSLRPERLDSRDLTRPVEITWSALGGLDYRSGRVSATLRRLDGQLVKLPGYIVPLEDDAQMITEFLLVPYFGACVHYPPPPPNQMVHVEMVPGAQTRMDWWRPVWIEGTLQIQNYDSPYGVAGFKLTGQRVVPYTPPRD